jgi:hypothetical protein
MQTVEQNPIHTIGNLLQKQVILQRDYAQEPIPSK